MPRGVQQVAQQQVVHVAAVAGHVDDFVPRRGLLERVQVVHQHAAVDAVPHRRQQERHRAHHRVRIVGRDLVRDRVRLLPRRRGAALVAPRLVGDRVADRFGRQHLVDQQAPRRKIGADDGLADAVEMRAQHARQLAHGALGRQALVEDRRAGHRRGEAHQRVAAVEQDRQQAAEAADDGPVFREQHRRTSRCSCPARGRRKSTPAPAARRARDRRDALPAGAPANPNAWSPAPAACWSPGSSRGSARCRRCAATARRRRACGRADRPAAAAAARAARPRGRRGRGSARWTGRSPRARSRPAGRSTNAPAPAARSSARSTAPAGVRAGASTTAAARAAMDAARRIDRQFGLDRGVGIRRRGPVDDLGVRVRNERVGRRDHRRLGRVGLVEREGRLGRHRGHYPAPRAI